MIEIASADRRTAAFRLEVSMNPVASDDGALTRHAVIENGIMQIRGSIATYRSANLEDKELGTCILRFTADEGGLSVVQSGKCWWFGEGVDASGTYRRTDVPPEGVANVK